MMLCDEIRATLALEPATEDAAVRAHLDGCAACARYSRRHHALDVVLRAELHWDAPAALTARLLALAAAPQVQLLHTQAAPSRPRPQGWYVTLVYALTLLAVGLSTLIAWQFVGMLVAQVPIGAAVTQLLALPGQGLAYLTQTLPETRIAVDFFMKVRDQLLWLLLVAVLWAALDKGGPRSTFSGRQISL